MAPLALLAALLTVAVLVSSTTGGDAPSSSSPTATTEREPPRTSTGERTTPATTTTAAEESGPSTYTVQAGDTLGSISAATGVEIAELQELNPGLDPQNLTVGDSIRLRR
jgi:LysM repeat protein